MDQSKKKLAPQMSGVFGKDDVKLEWMYKGPTDLLNREEYLLGRAIDKNFEELDNAEKTEKLTKLIGVTNPKNHVEHECVPLSIRAYKQIETSEQVDLQRKLLEDPLFTIKQKEMESRRRILENPVKLKQLSKILRKDETLRKHKKKSKNKKKKKKHKKSSSSDDSDDSDDDLDQALIRKLKKLDDSRTSKLDKELKALLNANKKPEDKKSMRNSQSSYDSDSDNKYRRRKNEHRYNERYDERKRERYDERKQYERNEQFHRRPRHFGDYSSNNRNRYDDDNSRSRRYERPSSSSISTKTPYSINNQRKNNDDKQKITEEEKSKKIREMMENANWREQNRSREVKKYRDECKNEEKQVSNFDHNFINKEMKKAISNQNSVESRIKSNINNIQRNTHSMNRNFAKR